MRVPDEAALGHAKATIRVEGWPEGQVIPSTHSISVAARKPLPAIKVAPEQRQLWSADGYSADHIRYTPDGKSLIVQLSKSLKDGTLYQYRLWDAATGGEKHKLFQIDPEPQTSMYTPTLALSKDGRLMAIRYNLIRYTKKGKDYLKERFYMVHVVDLQIGREGWRQELKAREGLGLAFSPDGRTVATTQFRVEQTEAGKVRAREFFGEVSFWDAASGRQTGSLPGGPYQLVGDVEYSPDGKYLVFGDEHRGKDSTYHVNLWDLASQKVRLRVTEPAPTEAVFSLDSTQLAVSSCKWVPQKEVYQKRVRVWDLATASQKADLALEPDRGWLMAPTWSWDGKYLYLTSDRGQVMRWDPSGKEPLAIKESLDERRYPEGETWPQHVQPASGRGAFGVNGKLPERITRRALADDYDELPPPEIVVWDLRTLERQGTLHGHRGHVNSVAFSPDGRTLVSGGTDGTIRVWSARNSVPAP